MKDTVITGKFKKRELTVFGSCFIVAYILNIYAIISFDRSWVELFSQIGFVVAISVALYIITAILRIVVHFIVKATKK